MIQQYNAIQANKTRQAQARALSQTGCVIALNWETWKPAGSVGASSGSSGEISGALTSQKLRKVLGL